MLSLKAYSRLVFLIFLVAFAVWITVIWKVNPEENSKWGLIVFYASLFLAVLSLWMSVSIFLSRKLMEKNLVKSPFNFFSNFRRGSLISAFLIIFLILKSLDWFTWWLGLLLLAGFLLAELHFSLNDNN